MFDGDKNNIFDWQTCILCLLSNYFGEIFPIFLILDVTILKALFGPVDTNQTMASLLENDPMRVSEYAGEVSSLETGGQITNKNSRGYRAVDFSLLKLLESNDISQKKNGKYFGKIHKA